MQPHRKEGNAGCVKEEPCGLRVHTDPEAECLVDVTQKDV